MNADALALSGAEGGSSPGLWTMAWQRFSGDRVGLVCAVVVVIYLVTALASGMGLIAADWSRETGISYAAPGFIGRKDPGPPAGPKPSQSVQPALPSEAIGPLS